MPNDKNNILQYQSETKSLKLPYIMVADTEALLKKHHSCANNFKKSYEGNQATHEACRYTSNAEIIYGTNKHSCCKELCDKSKEIVNAGKKRNYTINK